jgi:hypothetical protein
MVSHIGTHDFSGATVTGITGTTPTFDAVVAASGGDYTTLGAAITAGKTSIFIKDGTYTETGAITLPTNCLLFGESKMGAIVNMGANGLTTGENVTIYNLKLTFNRDGNLITIGGDFNRIDNCFIESLRGTNPTAQMGVITDNNVAQVRCKLTNLWFDVIPVSVNMANLTCFWIQNSGSDAWQISNIQTGGSASFHSKMLYVASSECLISNFLVWNVGTAGNSTVLVSGNYNQISNLSLKGSSGRCEISGNYNTMVGYNSDLATNLIYITGDGNSLSAISTLGLLEVTSAGVHNQIAAAKIDGGVTIAGNDNTIAGSSVGALAGGGAVTITVSAGANRVIISACRVDAAVSDGGTGTVASYEVF